MLRAAGMIVAGLLASLAVVRAADPDPLGVLRKPIPDKLVVLTFDDGPLSGYTVVAPILKSFGFGGSFYVCDFDSFRTRKDWYMTWRQMKAMTDAGFEIGNHTTGHAGGCRIGGFLSLEDDLVANGVPKPTTIAWPVFAVNTVTYPELAANGYLFGRGGHFRPYRPTVDNPFDIPCLGAGTMEEFVRSVRQAAGGRIVTLCYHGVPDLEHQAVSLDPAVFKAQMQYLKDNDYKVIALRDLAEYIDPAKAAKLPPTVRDFKEPGAPLLAKEDKPYVAMNLAPPKSEGSRDNKAPVRKVRESVAAVTAIDTAKPNLFAWHSAAHGNWSDASRWSNNLASGAAPSASGQPDYVIQFDQPGNHVVTNDLNEDFTLNRLSVGAASVKVAGKSLTLTASGDVIPPRIMQAAPRAVTIAVPITVAGPLTVDVADRNGQVILSRQVSGTGSLKKTGDGLLRIDHATNTFSGGTTIDSGCLCLYVADKGLGSGPIVLNDEGVLALEHVNGFTPLVLNGGEINANNGFGDTWSGIITLNGNTRITSYADFVIGAAMSGPGGFTQIGNYGGFGLVNAGQVSLSGTNTYTGATIVRRGTLRILKAASLYNGDPANWVPANISVHNTATLRLCAGGEGELTGGHLGVLLANLTSTVSSNGLMGGAVLCLDTARAREPVVVSADLSDSKGPGGGAFLLKKCGTGTLALTGNNRFTGQTILEDGTLRVASLNSVVHGRPASSLGAPNDIETGEIVIGNGDGTCALIHTGTGETSDRVMNLAGKKSTVTFEQSGTGLLKLTSPFVISGHSASKTIVLQGDTAGTGELAGSLFDPHDRAGKATTSLIKSGTGSWTLSGTNTYTGPTSVTRGTLVLAHARSLSAKTDVEIAGGATLELDFQGDLNVRTLTLAGKQQAPGTYDATSAPDFLKGTGVLRVQP